MRFLLKPNTENPAYTSMTFPAGEPHVKLNLEEFRRPATVTIEVQQFNFPLLAVCVDAIWRCRPDITLNLFLPYFPGARQDRVCEDGEALTSAVYARMINSLGFSKVVVMDPHSDVVPALIDNCRVIPHGTVYDNSGPSRVEVLDIFMERLDRPTFPLVVAPDAGAAKKVMAAIKRSSYPDLFTFAQGGKMRDTKTGSLTGFTLDKHVVEAGQPVIIMDDLNCRGGTFLGLAKLLRERGAQHITLFTTHSDTLMGMKNVLNNGIDQLITTNSEDTHERAMVTTPNLHVFNVFEEFQIN